MFAAGPAGESRRPDKPGDKPNVVIICGDDVGSCHFIVDVTARSVEHAQQMWRGCDEEFLDLVDDTSIADSSVIEMESATFTAAPADD